MVFWCQHIGYPPTALHCAVGGRSDFVLQPILWTVVIRFYFYFLDLPCGNRQTVAQGPSAVHLCVTVRTNTAKHSRDGTRLLESHLIHNLTRILFQEGSLPVLCFSKKHTTSIHHGLQTYTRFLWRNRRLRTCGTDTITSSWLFLRRT